MARLHTTKKIITPQSLFFPPQAYEDLTEADLAACKGTGAWPQLPALWRATSAYTGEPTHAPTPRPSHSGAPALRPREKQAAAAAAAAEAKRERDSEWSGGPARKSLNHHAAVGARSDPRNPAGQQPSAADAPYHWRDEVRCTHFFFFFFFFDIEESFSCCARH